MTKGINIMKFHKSTALEYCLDRLNGQKEVTAVTSEKKRAIDY